MKSFNMGQALTGLAIYEAMIDMRDTLPGIDQAFNDRGSWQMRKEAMGLIAPIEYLFQQLSRDEAMDGLAFDFEFIPEAMKLVDWENVTLDVGAAYPVLEQWRDNENSKWAHENWMSTARWYAHRHYGWCDMVRENPEWFDREFRDGTKA